MAIVLGYYNFSLAPLIELILILTYVSFREPTEDKETDEHDIDLRKRLNLPHGVTAAESCRSASPGDGGMTDSYRGDSCGSFEFLSKNRNRKGESEVDSEDDEDDQRLFFPQRNEEKQAILRQIATLNDGNFTENSRESSAQPEEEVESSKNDENAEFPLSKSSTEERSIPLVVAVADAARNPRIRGKPSRLRDLQQPVPMEENPQDVSDNK